ncbi:MAG: DNA-processing protein DprA [Lutibacter sp.]
MKKDELFHILALQTAKGIGSINAKKLISTCGSAKNIFQERKSTLAKINGIGTYLLDQLFDKNNFIKAEEELNYLLNNKIKIDYFLDENYPKNLKQCIDGPILFFSKGNLNLNKSKSLSIVGTRKITSYGKSFCKSLIKELTPFNPLIVSGFAYGVDICAHREAIKNKLQTVGVLAHGFDTMYPKVHQKYTAEVEHFGGFISEFWHSDLPVRENFLKRNRIIAGLTDATIVIESAGKGGALVTADIANSYNREVFAVPGRVHDKQSEGCNRLIKQNKAAILTQAEDIVKNLNWDVQSFKSEKIKQQSLFVELNNQETLIFNYLKENGKELLDIIAINCQLPIYKTTAILFDLEMKGVVNPLPGKFFEVV